MTGMLRTDDEVSDREILVLYKSNLVRSSVGLNSVDMQGGFKVPFELTNRGLL